MSTHAPCRHVRCKRQDEEKKKEEEEEEEEEKETFSNIDPWKIPEQECYYLSALKMQKEREKGMDGIAQV
ncbi:hypothetical protein HZH68_002244 [Vespula germanica]|uniref:Uncharacterized protein n=1 Tax=Vespula germanica TaxID=30212 RepID=A0A834KXV8_VESGE|nr:hypothetical protein HZH68_002244 [Vespula germanica]